MKRWPFAALLAFATGCSTILGFEDGKLADPFASPPSEAGCGGPEGGSDGGPSLITTFEGAPAGIVAAAGYVYLTYGSGVWGCSTTQSCDSPASIYNDGSETRPLAFYGSRLVWAHPVLGKLRECFLRMLERCSTTNSYDEPGVQAITADVSGNLYWLRTNAATGSAELRLRPNSGPQTISTVATFPGASTSVAIAATGLQIVFVMIGGVAYSVFVPQGPDAGPSTVTPLVSDPGAAPVATRIVTTAARVVWPRGKSGGLWQCPLDETRTAPCVESTAAPFAGAGEDITALAASGDTVVWAREAQDKNDILMCTVTPGVFTAAACTPVVVASDVGGRVTALTVDAIQGGPSLFPTNVYFTVGDASGSQRLEKVPLPR